MKILVDTNVIVAGLIAKGACFEILEDIVYSHTPVYTPFIHSECLDVLLNKFRLSKPTVKALVVVIERHFTKGRSAQNLPQACRDPKDNQILADAVYNKVDIILSGDKDLIALGSYEGIKIVSPGQYWKI